MIVLAGVVVDHDNIFNKRPIVSDGSGKGDMAQTHFGVQQKTRVVLVLASAFVAVAVVVAVVVSINSVVVIS